MIEAAMSCGIQRESYTRLQMTCHWAIALFCLVEFPTASSIQRIHIGRVFGITTRTYDMWFAAAHELLGWSLLVLTLVLIVSRVLQGAPSLPSGMAWWQRWLAHAAHAAIYAGVLAIVVTGVATAHFDGRFGLSHTFLTKVGIALIALHIGATIWHQLLRHDGLLRRMLPTGRRNSP